METKINKSNIKISVIIPSFRPKQYTLDCLTSIKNQTLDTSKYEVIVILNGEKEPYYSMLEDNMPANGILFYSPIASACTSRNIGLDKAKGEYICFIDDDDKVSPNYLQELLKHATPNTIGVSYCLSLFDDMHEESNVFTCEYVNYNKKGIQAFYKPQRVFSTPWMKLIHRDIIGKIRFNEHFPSGQDSLMMFEISNRIKYVDFTSTDAVYYWRQRSGSLHRMGLHKRVNKYGRLICVYTYLFFGHIGQYNLHFYTTRILASFRAIIAPRM